MSGTSSFSRDLIDWYELHQRDLPWNNTHDPYMIWVSEIILQQTQVRQGLPYYANFIKRFPNVNRLADARLDDVLKAWEGLGYYSRARNLHKGAQFVVKEFNGRVPESREELLTIPGIGPYTSAAIAAFAFGQKEAAIDGNLMRVLTRVHTYPGDITKASTRKYLEEIAIQDMGTADPAAFNRALMDLGSTICKATSPDCHKCPVSQYCEAFQSGQVTNFPFSTKKIIKKKRYLHYLLCKDASGKGIRLQQRDDSGIWKGLYELPSMETDKKRTLKKWTLGDKEVELKVIHKDDHVLTHRLLHIKFYQPTDEVVGREAIRSVLDRVAFPAPIRSFLKKIEKDLL